MSAHSPAPLPIAADEIELLLFDVGGVLVEINGVSDALQWLDQRLDLEAFWRRWLYSPAVRAFETGRIEPTEFADRVLAEFDWHISPAHFLESFIAWPTGLFPGTLPLLQRIPARLGRALLSNSNVLHWPRMLEQMGLGAAFEQRFASHLMGRIKPDADAFGYVLETLAYEPAQVLFLDDNPLNIVAATALGIPARRVQGSEQTLRLLCEVGIVEAGRTV